jgi:hypothetical protein
VAGVPEKDKAAIEVNRRHLATTTRSSMSRLAMAMYIRRLDEERTFEQGDGI